jgi:diaminohydroxyphosphoribosylaminopyrimidine deaminase/5-amino-6-(5-phosphoribosylamino)uracil reductase
MQTALELAIKGWPNVAPNPLVGAVIVKDGKIIASGYHEKFGEAHAEVNAIKDIPAGTNPKECALYVTLEPCSHFGKTPPCADLIINTGFKKVVICNHDPNPLVAGQGIEKLRKAGIEVLTGVLEEKGKEQNRRFFTYHEKHRPFFILKWAQTADNFISRKPVPSNREENLISEKDSHIYSHSLRAAETAIMVGKNTAIQDDPLLTTRLVNGKNPLRVLIDQNLGASSSLRIYNPEADTLIFNAVKEEKKEHLTFSKIDFSGDVLKQVASKLYHMKVQSVIVEGGFVLLESFIREDMWDEAHVIVNPSKKFISGVKAPAFELPGEFLKLGADHLYVIRNKSIDLQG